MKNIRNSKSKNDSTPLQVFTTWSEDVIAGRRLDVKYWIPATRELQEAIQQGKYKSQKLGDFITDIRYGVSTTNEYVDSGVPLLRILNLKTDGLDLSKIVYLPESRSDEIGKAIVHENDLLISRSGSVGIVIVVPKEADGFAFGSFMIRFCLNDKINKQYVAAWLNGEASRKLIERGKIGAIQGNITIETIKNFDIPIPPISIQNEVVKKIQKAYEQRQTKEAEVESVLLSIDDFVFGELGIDIPKESPERVFQIWSNEVEGRVDVLFYKPILRNLLDQITRQRHFTLGEAITEMSGGATPKVTGDYYLDEGGVPFLRVQNITEMGINLDDVKFIKPEVHEKMLKRSQLKGGDLVFTIIGRPGTVSVIPNNFKGNISQNSVRFHLRDKIKEIRILPEYTAIFLNTKFGKDLSLRWTAGGAQPALNADIVKKLLVPLPSEESQKRIVGKVGLFYERVRALKTEADEVLLSAQKQVEQMILS